MMLFSNWRNNVSDVTANPDPKDFSFLGGVYILGDDHDDVETQEKLRAVSEAASLGKCNIAVFCESHFADREEAQSYSDLNMGVDSLFFGYEDDAILPITLIICGLVSAYNPQELPGSNYLVQYKQNMMAFGIMHEGMRRAWRNVSENLLVRQKFNEVLAIYHDDLQRGVSEPMGRVYSVMAADKELFLSPEWIEVYRSLFMSLKSNLPEELREPFEDPRLTSFIESYNTTGVAYWEKEINGTLREGFIVRNITKTLQEHRSQLQGKDVLVSIGSAHLERMQKSLSDALNLPVHAVTLEYGCVAKAVNPEVGLLERCKAKFKLRVLGF